MIDIVEKIEFKKSSVIFLAVFIFPSLIATLQHGSAIPYIVIFLSGMALGWPAWRSLEGWEKKLLVGYIVFFLLISLSLINTEDLREGIKKVERYIHFPLLIPMYLLLKRFNIEAGRAFLYGIALASVIMFSQALYQSLELGYVRIIGAYHPIIFGNVAMLIAMIAVGALVTIAKTWQSYLLAIAVISLALSASVMSASRGSWIVLPVIMLGLLWLKRKSFGRTSLFSILVLMFLLFWGVLQIDHVKNRVELAISDYQDHEENSTKLTSVRSRLDMWRDAVTIWKANPVFGTGIGDYGGDRLKLYEEGKLPEYLQFGHAHSIYFDVLASAGLVGFFAMLVCVLFIPFRMFYLLWKGEEDSWIQFYALSGMITITAFAVFGLTEAWLARNPFVRTYLMCVLVFMSSISLRKASLSSTVKT